MKLGQDDARKNLTCWNRDTQAQCLRVELADGGLYIFPYNHVACVRFEPGNGIDTLCVGADTHEIQITGTNLREVALAFQKLAVEWVKALPARHGALSGDDDARINSITVKEIQP